jgi:CubicO group peptidase (beta-lactamase class C family)
MILYEEGAFALSDPVSALIPAFSETQVYQSGPAEDPVTEPTAEPIRIWHLLTHTAGLGPANAGHPVEAMYHAAGFGPGPRGPEGVDLAAYCNLLAGLPLLFEPGAEWNYSLATNVLGRVVEVASGQSLDRFMAERIFEPLGMPDTAFWVDGADAERVATRYTRDAESGTLVRDDNAARSILVRPTYMAGAGGLVSTAPDYYRFATMLLRRGELDGVRLLGSRTVDYMMANHLPGRADLESFGRPLLPPKTLQGIGFGLGLGVVDDPVANKVLCSSGAATWGGATTTEFWVDPREEMVMLLFAQVVPFVPFTRLRQLVYQALVD